MKFNIDEKKLLRETEKELQKIKDKKNQSKGPGMCRRNPELPPSAHSIRMMELWQDPTYREAVRNRVKKNWQDPEYREKQAKKYENPSQKRLTMAERYREQAKKLKKQAQVWLNQAATLEYYVALLEHKEYKENGLVMTGKVIHEVGKKHGLYAASGPVEDKQVSTVETAETQDLTRQMEE